VIGVVLSYGISCLISGTTASFLVLRRMKDGEILLEWTDEVDELEERTAAKAEPMATGKEQEE
jgi:hypothetical protein